MKFNALILFLVIFSMIPLFAVHKDAGTSGFQFLKVHYSARALGMANAFTGMADDVDAVYFNPAGLAQQKDMSIKSNYINYVDGMNGGSVAFNMPYQDDYSIAFFAQYLNAGDIQRTSANNDGTYNIEGTFTASDLVAGASIAKKVKDNLDLGISAKILYESLDDVSASALNFDFGLRHQTTNEKLIIGIVVKNVGMQLSYYTDDEYKEKMPMIATAGAYYKFNEKFTGNLDISRPMDNDFYGKAGVEYQLSPMLTLRGGFDSRSSDYKAGDTFEAFSGLAGGFGIHYKKYTFDYGIASMGDLGWNNQVSIKYQF